MKNGARHVIVGTIRLKPLDNKCGFEIYDPQGSLLDRLEPNIRTLLSDLRKPKELCRHATAFLPATEEEVMAAFIEAKRDMVIDMDKKRPKAHYDAEIKHAEREEENGNPKDLVGTLIAKTIKVERFTERADEEDVSWKIYLKNGEAGAQPFTLTNKQLLTAKAFRAKYLARCNKLIPMIEPWPDLVNHWMTVAETAPYELPETPALLIAERLEQQIRNAHLVEANSPEERKDTGLVTSPTIALRDGDTIWYASDHIQQMILASHTKVSLIQVSAVLRHRESLIETSRQIRVGKDRSRFWGFKADKIMGKKRPTLESQKEGDEGNAGGGK